MIGLLIGLIIGVGITEYMGRLTHGYSVIVDSYDWIRDRVDGWLRVKK